MRIQEQMEPQGKLEITPEELELIKQANPQAQELEADDLYAFSCRGIDNAVTDNGRIYSADFQRDCVDRRAWEGVPLVFQSDDQPDHSPNISDNCGWCYQASLGVADGVTFTTVKCAIPKIDSTEEVIQRLKCGLARGVSLAAEISKEVFTKNEAGVDVVGADQNARILHLALVSAQACRSCVVDRQSESVKPLDEETVMLITEAKNARIPVIERCCRASRLLEPKQDVETLRTRFSKWTLSELTHFAEVNESLYKAQNPQASTQQSIGYQSVDVPRANQPKSIADILQDIK